MKLHILKDLVDGPWGGGNQFLKALRKCWEESGRYADSPLDADGILVNSHHHLLRAVQIKRSHPGKCFVHRVDGPIALGRKNGGELDNLIFQNIRLTSEAVVFQSAFSRSLCLEAGLQLPPIERTILNAPNPAIFYKKNFNAPHGKTRIVATSWSTNKTKGFEIYRYLDQHLNFNRYQMTFIGNSPIKFRNIECQPAQNSEDLARSLRAHDIFLTASAVDPCSNSLLEGLHCGLPAVALKSGGHPSIVRDAGVLFAGVHDVLSAIDDVADHLKVYHDRICLPDINQVSALYLEAFECALGRRKENVRPSAPSSVELIGFASKWAWLRLRGAM